MSSELDALLEQADGVVFPFSEEYEKAHVEFAEKMWPHKLRRRIPDYNRWKFRGGAHGPVDGFLLAVIDGQVVGQLGLIPVTLMAGEQRHPAQWACDLIVDPSVRRKGFGSLLLATGMARPMVTLGSDPSPLADAAMTRLGFWPVNGPWQMLLPLKPESEIEIRLPAGLKRFAPWLSTMAAPLIRFQTRKLRRSNHATAVRLGDWMEVAEFISSNDLQSPHILHDSAFLQWRGGGLAGFSPVLESVYSGPDAFAVFQSTPNQFYVYEWHARDFVNALLLFSSIYQLAKERDSHTIIAFANDNDERDWLGKLGFLKKFTPTKIIYYPDSPLSGYGNFHYDIYDSDGNL